MWSLVALLSFAGVASAQDDGSRDEELRDLRRRLEALEQSQAQQQAQSQALDPTQALPGAAIAADPVEKHWYDSVKVGGGVRASFAIQSDENAKGTGYGYNFRDEQARLYTSGDVNDWISVTLNAEFTTSLGAAPAPGSGAQAGVLDAIAQFKLMKEGQLNIWVGRLLPPSDRSNLDGPFYLATWTFPVTSINFNNETNGFGRDDGMSIWGDIEKFKYVLGVFEGDNVVGSTGHLLWAAKLQYDILDPEHGYYMQSTYYGKQRTLAISLAMNGQDEAILGVAGFKGSMNFNIDVLYEDKIGDGVITVEGDYYRYNRGGYGPEAVTAGDIGSLGQGDGFLILVAFLIPGNIGPGQFQPHVRYQGFVADGPEARNPEKQTQEQLDLGVNYVMEGHNARITVVYSMGHKDNPGPAFPPAGPLRDGVREFLMGAQVQF